MEPDLRMAQSPMPSSGGRRADAPTSESGVCHALAASNMHQLLGYHCRRAFLHLEPFSDPRMSRFGLRPADFAVLSLLLANPGLSQKEVAHGIGVAPPNLAPVLERLEARELLLRQRSVQDGRIQHFFLTAPGKALCREAEAQAAQIESEAASALTDSERDTLMALLQKLYDSGNTKPEYGLR